MAGLGAYFFLGRLVSRLKNLWGASSYLVLRDFFPQWVIDNGLLSTTSPITCYFKFFEALSYRAAEIFCMKLRRIWTVARMYWSF